MKRTNFAIITLFSIVVIFVAVVFMYGGSFRTERPDSTFEYGLSYYTPKEGEVSDRELYATISNTTYEGPKCPQETPVSADVLISTVDMNTAGVRNFFIPADSLHDVGNYANYTSMVSSMALNVDDSNIYTLVREKLKPITVTFDVEEKGQKVHIEDHLYEIVAPFNFVYKSKNIDGHTIVLENLASNDMYKRRIVFVIVSNWYCAGDPNVYVGEPTDEALYAEYSSWVKHGQSHASLIGNSSNSIYQGGDAGQIVGYGNESTQVTYYSYSNGSWSKCTLEDFYTK